MEEKVISEENRTINYLKKIVKDIYKSILETEKYISVLHPSIEKYLPNEITFIHTEELKELYPSLTSKERENKICKTHGAVFLIGIGGLLDDGKKHDGAKKK